MCNYFDTSLFLFKLQSILYIIQYQLSYSSEAAVLVDMP